VTPLGSANDVPRLEALGAAAEYQSAEQSRAEKSRAEIDRNSDEIRAVRDTTQRADRQGGTSLKLSWV
jgi:hypothetical protein